MVYLHVVSLNDNDAAEAELTVQGRQVTGGAVQEIAPGRPRECANRERPNVFEPEEKPLEASGTPTWRFSPRFVVFRFAL